MYTTEDGKKPAKDFIFILDEKMQAKMLQKAILTNGFVKKSQKTPKRE